MSSYYEALGVIIPKEYDESDLTWANFDREYRFTPNVQDIKKAEEILFQGYNNHNRNLKSTGNDYQDIHDVQLHLKNYPRQYLGFINKEGDRVILINLLREMDSSILRENMHCWDSRFVVVIDLSLSDRGSTFYRANLESETIE